MRSHFSAFRAVVALSLCAPCALSAQQPTRAGIAHSGALQRVTEGSMPPMVRVLQPPASPWPYVAIGAFVGGVATVAAVSWSLEQSGKECICSPMTFVPVVVGGAVLGGTGGYIVYRIRF